jgi:hypothetical protein
MKSAARAELSRRKILGFPLWSSPIQGPIRTRTSSQKRAVNDANWSLLSSCAGSLA